MLTDQKTIFDEDFETYGWEDIELGFRLHQDGMRLCFEPGATAVHDHPVTVRDFCKRQLDVGISSRIFLEKHPELKNFLGDENTENWAKLRLPAELLSFVTDFFDQKNIRLPSKIYKFILHTYYCVGTLSQNGQRSIL
jgi:GT2 family glycosyltransferase